MTSKKDIIGWHKKKKNLNSYVVAVFTDSEALI